MPLRCRLFAGCKPLEACLVSDTAHVTPGARGEHVSRIQSALVRLRVMEPRQAVAEAGHYGPRTADAVLMYKRALRIVNHSYQSSADNIVGRMTVASLDHAIFVLDGGNGMPRRPAPLGPHPQSPVSGGIPARTERSLVTAPLDENGGGTAFTPPLSELPLDLQAVVRRSNDAKRPDTLLLFPFLAKHEGQLPAAALSARFGGQNAAATDILKALHLRMTPFGIWKNVRIIVNVYQGTGSKGIFCEPFDHDAFLVQMVALTEGPRLGPPPNVVPLSVPLSDSKFCKDMFNVHGPRDSFREMVKQGPGLHICISQPAVRSTHACDLHIDQVQQGQVCSQGRCIPILNGQTIEHLHTVGPWLAEEAKKWLPKF